MEKEKLIQEIKQNLEALEVYADRLEKNPEKAHRMDLELMIEKTRKIYDVLIRLDVLIIPFEADIREEVTPEPEETAEINNPRPEPISDTPSEPSEIPDHDNREYEEQITPEKKPETPQETNAGEILTEEQVAESPVSKEEFRTEPETEKEFPEESSEEDPHKSTIDLFSTAEPTVSDKYSEQEPVTLADKLNKEGINELREAIGINEKFLFINELFNGDMSKYNKVIDELDEMSTLKGAETYLLELKVQNQWAEDNQAFAKLSELLKRKFGM
jgi:hypothetical protein